LESNIEAKCFVDFFVATEDPANTLTRSMFPTCRSFTGFPFPTLIDPRSLGDIPKQELVIVVHRETKEVFVRKMDGKVYKIKVKTDKQEKSKNVDERELGKNIGKNDEKEAMNIRRIIGEKKETGDEWDDCMV